MQKDSRGKDKPLILQKEVSYESLQLEQNFRVGTHFSKTLIMRFRVLDNNLYLSLRQNKTSSELFLFGRTYHDWFTPGINSS